MFDFLKNNDDQNKPQDVKSIRDVLLRAIKEALQKVEGGEGQNIKGLYLYFTPGTDERHLYEAAVYFDQPGKFQKEEVQRIADDYDLELPENWILETEFVDSFPPETKPIPGLQAALFIKTKQHTIRKSATAFVTVLNGEAEKEKYILSSESGKVTIGREKKVQVDDGFFRINTIAFPADSKHEGNKYISRNHAHIEWDNESGQFLLFADEGGIPPRNKIKVRSSADTNPIKLQATHTGYTLQEGDQIVLGDSAVLLFSYSDEN